MQITSQITIPADYFAPEFVAVHVDESSAWVAEKYCERTIGSQGCLALSADGKLICEGGNWFRCGSHFLLKEVNDNFRRAFEVVEFKWSNVKSSGDEVYIWLVENVTTKWGFRKDGFIGEETLSNSRRQKTRPSSN